MNKRKWEGFPDWPAFRAAPLAEIRHLAPATICFGAGGTRRGAVLAGVADRGDAYAQWSRARMMACFSMLFEHGVGHIFTPAIIPSQVQEVTAAYRERLESWVAWGLAGDEALADYERLGWRVRLLGTEQMPGLAATATRLRQATPDPPSGSTAPTLWWRLAPTQDSVWKPIIEAVKGGASDRRSLIKAVYGEEVPPAGIFLSFGKPIVSPALLPPLLLERVQCYWMQRPSYELTAEQWRAILYDYSYLRATWRADKSGRAEAALASREAWESGPTLGLGIRLGPFWYPAPSSAPGGDSVDHDLFPTPWS